MDGAAARISAIVGGSRLRGAVAAYLVALLGVNLLICFWIGGNDYDSFAFHVVRTTLEQFGPLSETATTQLQLVFPRFFDDLHTPFLRLGYFLSLPTVALFLAVLIALCFENARRARVAIVLLFSSQVVVASISALKNDLGLALIAFLCWLAIYRVNSRHIYAPLVLLLLCALVGTKWHGFFLAAPLGLCFLYELWTRRLFSWPAAILTVAALPLYVVVSSLPVYISNVAQYGTLFPLSALAQYEPGVGVLARNIYHVAGLAIVDTFTLPLYLLDRLSEGAVWRGVNAAFPGSKWQNFAVMPSSIVAVHGYVLLLVLVCCAIVAIRREYDRSLRAAAAVALVFFVTIEALSAHNDLHNRYLLASLLLGLLPTAALLANLRLPRALTYIACGYMAVVGTHATIMHHERPLVALSVYYPERQRVLSWPSIWENIGDREMLQFGMWLGYRQPFAFYRQNIPVSDSFTIVNNGNDVDVPFLYPFLARREGANTAIVNLRGKPELPRPVTTDFVMTYKHVLTDPNYREIYSFRNTERFYRRSTQTPDPPAQK